MKPRAWFIGFLWMVFGLAIQGAELNRSLGDSRAAALSHFEKKIRPVLVERCYECHSADAKKIKGGLRLDTREAMLAGGEGGPVIVPGDPDKSRLMEALRYSNEDLQMPPKEKLSPEQIADFELWIRQGALDSRTELRSPISGSRSTNHWAFQPPKDSAPPKVKDRKWPKSPIDNFILVELEEKKLKPVPPADKRTLIRRATFDLTGLPPKPEEIDAFLGDQSSDAFAKLIDRLLDSQHFGERWGRHWLDVARYADSNGLEVNIPYPNAWRYRDYVIESFNQDKPFNEFIREQIAGDLLPYGSNEERFRHLIATGFLVLGPKTLTEPNQEKLIMDVTDEQIDVTTKAFLGLTASCARCHDHKFDPIPTRDYYAMAGIFKSTASLSSASPLNPGAPRWMERPLATEDKAKEIEAYNRELNKLVEELRNAQEHPGGLQSSKLPGIVVDNTAARLTGRWKESLGLTNFVDKNYLADGNSDKGMMSARFVPNLPHTGLYQVLVAYTPWNNRATNVPVTVEAKGQSQLIIINQRAAPQYWSAFASIGTFEFQSGTNGSVTISNAGTKGFVIADAVQFVPIDEWKLVSAQFEESNMANSGSMMKESPGTSAEFKMASTMRTSMAKTRSPYDLQNEIGELKEKAPPPAPSAMAVEDGNPQNCRINVRGDFEKLGDEVPRGFIKVVGGNNSAFSKINPKSSGRLELADWIASPQNPLTARVAANRVWLHLFGKGLVETPDNFGLLGEKPNHPELLDYLARRFIAEGWSVKRMIRAIMLTSTYQMSCDYDAKAFAKDPDDHYLWRMNRRRLEAEEIRDAILTMSGRLDLTPGGSPMPTNAPPINGPMAAIPQVESNRRSVYLPVLRNNVTEIFQVFDFVDPHAVAGKRHITSAAPQSLFMLNSEFVMEQSKLWAESLLKRAGAEEKQGINAAYTQAFGRLAKADESDRTLRFLQRFTNAISDPTMNSQQKRLLAWQSFCQALLASTEFRFLN